MQLTTPPPATALAGLRAMKTVAMADGPIHELARSYIQAIQHHILKVDAALDEVELIDPEALAEAVPDPMFRERIIRGLVLVALIDGEASEEEEAVIAAYSGALGTDRAPLRTMHRIVHKQLGLLKIDIVRRAFIGKRLKAQFADKGIRGFRETIQALRGKENPALAAKYLALESKPLGTLGRAYWDFTRSAGFSFPGEVGGPPEPLVFHDCVHVLADYGTSVSEEAAVVAFQGGFQNYDFLHTILFAVAQFHLGLQISPIAGSERLGVTDPEAVVKSFLLGTKCNRDLSDGWDPWLDFDYTVKELRERYNILTRPP